MQVVKPKRSAKRSFDLDDATDGAMDAYAQYNPHGGAYRGIDVEEHAATLGDMRDLQTLTANSADVPIVAFKKRRKRSKKKNSRKPTSDVKD